MAISGQGHTGTLALQGLPDHIPVPVMIVHHQEAQTRQPVARRECHWRAGDHSSLTPLLRGRLRRRRLIAGHREPEAATDPLTALAAQGAAHEFDQLPGDGETQAGAAKTAGDGAIGLGKGGAKADQIFRGDADTGVPDLETEPHLAAVGTGAEADAGFRAVLRVASVLADNLYSQRLTPQISSILHLLLQAKITGILPLLLRAEILGTLHLLTEDEPDLPPFSELHRVTQQVEENLLQPQGIAQQAFRKDLRHLDLEREPLGGGHLAQEAQELGQQSGQVEGSGFQVDLTPFDLGEVKDVVDDCQQALAGGEDVAHPLPLLGGQILQLQQLRQTQHGIHGGADFMAHVGQELALGRIGTLGVVLGLEQGLFALFAGGDVRNRAHHAPGTAVGFPFHHLAPVEDPDTATIRREHAMFGRIGGAISKGVLDAGHDQGAILGMEIGGEKGHGMGLGDALLADQPAPLLVVRHMVLGDIPVPGPFPRRIQDVGQPFLGFAQVGLALAHRPDHAVEGVDETPEFGTAFRGQLHVETAGGHGPGTALQLFQGAETGPEYQPDADKIDADRQEQDPQMILEVIPGALGQTPRREDQGQIPIAAPPDQDRGLTRHIGKIEEGEKPGRRR